LSFQGEPETEAPVLTKLRKQSLVYKKETKPIMRDAIPQQEKVLPTITVDEIPYTNAAGTSYRIVTINRRTSDPRKWIHHLSYTDAILYLVDISTFSCCGMASRMMGFVSFL